jgi:hypothetical protein
MITHVIGNLVTYPLDGFIHQANCQCTMGSGVAKFVKETYPEVYEADLLTLKGDLTKMGSFSFAKTTDGKIGYNLYSQFNFGYDGKCYTDYEAIRCGLTKIKDHIKLNIREDAKIGIPCRMGCARGGGDWNIVMGIIKDIFENDTINIVICEFKEYSQQEEDFKNKLRKAYKTADVMGKLESNDE